MFSSFQVGLMKKKKNVSVTKVIWISTFGSFVSYFAFGLFATVAISGNANDNVLNALGQSSFILTKLAAYFFSILVVAPGIPVYCISCRYNLYVGEVFGKKMSFFFGVIFPWLISFIFAQGTRFANFISWASLIFSGIINFILPFIIYLKSLELDRNEIHNEYLFKENEVDESQSNSVNASNTVQSEIHQHLSIVELEESERRRKSEELQFFQFNIGKSRSEDKEKTESKEKTEEQPKTEEQEKTEDQQKSEQDQKNQKRMENKKLAKKRNQKTTQKIRRKQMK